MPLNDDKTWEEVGNTETGGNGHVRDAFSAALSGEINCHCESSNPGAAHAGLSPEWYRHGAVSLIGSPAAEASTNCA